MKYSNNKQIKQILLSLVNIFLIILAVINLYDFFIKNKYLALLFFFVTSLFVYYFNSNLAIILSISLIITNIINSFTNLFNNSILEGYTEGDLGGLRQFLDDKYDTDFSNLMKYAGGKGSKDILNYKKKNDAAFDLLSKVINTKKYSSDATIMSAANKVLNDLTTLWNFYYYGGNSISTQTIINQHTIIDNDVKKLKDLMNKLDSKKDQTKSTSAPPKNVQPPKPVNVICDNILDTKLCCDRESNKVWNELTGDCNIK